MDASWKKVYMDVNELMKVVPVKRSKAYEIIKSVNEDLRAAHKFVIPGKAPRRLVFAKLGIE